MSLPRTVTEPLASGMLLQPQVVLAVGDAQRAVLARSSPPARAPARSALSGSRVRRAGRRQLGQVERRRAAGSAGGLGLAVGSVSRYAIHSGCGTVSSNVPPLP